MKPHLLLIALPLLSLLSLPSLLADRRVINQEVELHELDRRQAKDMALAWSDLLQQKSDDHYIKATLNGNLAPKGYELIRLKVNGTLINLSFQKLDDDDETRSLMTRARELLRLEVLKRPW
jgi:hypothetical protein